jgi:hypothetical protein
MLYLFTFILGVLARHVWGIGHNPAKLPKGTTAASTRPALPTGATRTRDDDQSGDGDPSWRFDLKE